MNGKLLTTVAYRTWQRLITPNPAIIEQKQRRQAELLATLMILLIPLVVLLILLSILNNPASPFTQYQYPIILLGLLVPGLVIYALSRTTYYMLGALLAIILSTAGIFGAVFIVDQFDINFLIYMLVPILLCSFFFSLRTATGLFFALTLGGLLLPRLPTGIQYSDLFDGPLSYFVIICLIVLLTRRYRNILEGDRLDVIEKSEERYRIVSEMTSDYAYSVRVDAGKKLTVEWITQAFTRVTGYDHTRSNDWDAFVFPDDLPIAQARAQRLLDGHEDISTFRIITKSGDIRWLREVGRPVLDATGCVVRIDGAVQDITDERDAEEQLQLLDLAVHSAREGIMILTASDAEPRIVFVNSGLQTLTGLDSAQLLGQPLSVFETIMPVMDEMLNAVRIGESFQTQTRNEHLDKQPRYLEWYVSPVQDEQATITHFIAIVRNITERKQMEQAEQDQRLLAEGLRDMAATLTSTLELDEVLDLILHSLTQVVPHDSGNITLLKDGMGEMVRRQRKEANGVAVTRPMQRYVIQDVPTLQHMLETGRPRLVNDTSQAKDWINFPGTDWMRSYVGVPIWLDNEIAGFLQLTSQQVGGFTAQHADRLEAFANLASIALHNAQSFKTKQQQAEELEKRVIERTAQLFEVQKRQQAILDAVGEGVFYTEDQAIEYVNGELCKQTGYPVHELSGQPATIFQNEDDPLGWANLAHKLNHNRIWRGEVQVRRQDGECFDAGITIAQVSEPGEQPLRAVTVVRDISQEKALQEQRNRFIAIASHELRTPLTNFMTRLYLLRRQPDRLDTHVQILDDAAEQMKLLVDNLLDLTRLEQGAVRLNRHRVRTQEIIETVMRLQQSEAQSKAINLEMQLDPEPRYVLADSGRLQQVISNLVTNAIKFTPPDGCVTVKLTTQPWDGQDAVVIHVIDTGVGIPPEHQAHIFEPFHRVDDTTTGTGLGLSITREIVELHGGNITMESEPGRGACFTVKLRLAADETA